MLGAFIAAGASLIGGAANRRAQREANEANRPANQVREWEAAGINPLFGISSGGYIPHQAASMGDAFATAGAQIQRGMELDHADKIRETELAQENEKLREQLDEFANPRRPGYMQQYGALLPLPSVGEVDVAPVGNTTVPRPVLDRVARDDLPYIPGNFWDTGVTPGSKRIVAPDPDNTLQPISVLGMTLRGTGTTSAAHRVEDNAGDVAGSAWAIPVFADYAVGTYLHNIGRPFAEWMLKPNAKKKRVKRPSARPKPPYSAAKNPPLRNSYPGGPTGRTGW